MLINAYNTVLIVVETVSIAVNSCGDSDFLLILAIESLAFSQK